MTDVLENGISLNIIKLQSDDLLPAVTSGYPRRASGASWHIMDLLRFPVDDEEPNLRHDDRIFTSLNHKSIMLMREYESIPKQQRLKSNDWYQKQSKTMDLHQQHAESDQRRAISHHQKSDQRHPGSDRQYQRLSELKDLPEQQAKHRKAFQQRPDFGEQFQQQPTFVSDIIHHQPDLRRQGQQLIGYGSWQQQQVKNVGTHRLTPDKGVCPEQVQKPYHRVYRMQKPKVNEYGRF